MNKIFDLLRSWWQEEKNPPATKGDTDEKVTAHGTKNPNK
jgi:hypothetical protein